MSRRRKPADPVQRMKAMVGQIMEARERGNVRASPQNIAKGLRLAALRRGKRK